ncbi:MAG: phage terminase large subunit family protein [Veillonella sp.]|nr:phage terminase large subunit family protein [Veillonella sp.]
MYFKGIISEHKKRVKKNGIIREIWEPTAGVRNEPLDLRVYNLACVKSINPNWDQLEDVVRNGGTKAVEIRPKKVTKHKKSTRRASSSASIY